MQNSAQLDSSGSTNPTHNSTQRSTARSKEATHNNTLPAPTRYPLPVRRQKTTTSQRLSASPELIGNTDGLDSPSSRIPSDISAQQQGARKQHITHQPNQHDIRFRFTEKRPQQRQQQRRGTITATSASPELIRNTHGQGMNMLHRFDTASIYQHSSI